MLDLGDDPTRWIPDHGKPAACLDVFDGLPTYETDDGRAVVYTLLAAADHQGWTGGDTQAWFDQPLLFPSEYNQTCVESVVCGSELVSLSPTGTGWRPLVYQDVAGRVTRFGSQQELAWRWAVGEQQLMVVDREAELHQVIAESIAEPLSPDGFVVKARARLAHWDDWENPTFAANRKAGEILREHLCPQQRLDLEATGCFYVRGTTNQLYRIQPGNGVAVVDPATLGVLVSICIHPDRWVPHDDVALALKLMIDSGPAGEAELLEGGRARPILDYGEPTPDDLVAWDIGRHLLPEPRET